MCSHAKSTAQSNVKMEKTEEYHIPVLLKQSVDGLNIQPGGVYVDVTFGGGGHSREILSRMDSTAHLYSFDQDADAEQNILTTEGEGKRFVDDPRFTFVRSNFRYLKNWMRYYGVDHIDGLLGDLGVSSHHFDDESRGFSFRFDAPLDMRMNKRAGTTAADIVNTATESQLADIFYLYGELRSARRIAAAIAKARAEDKPGVVLIGRVALLHDDQHRAHDENGKEDDFQDILFLHRSQDQSSTMMSKVPPMRVEACFPKPGTYQTLPNAPSSWERRR